MESVSVIIPTYNRELTLSRALDSVFSQSYPITEVIVIDDGSTDSTESLVKNSYPQVNFLQQSNRGVSAARNLGIKQAVGSWLAFLDSDDEWLPHKLDKQFAALAERPESRLIHSDEIWIRNGIRVNPMDKHHKFGGDIFEKCLPLCAISPSAAVVHQALFKAVGLFDESLPACEDYDLWLRICCKYPALYVKDKLVRKFGGHEDQLSRQHWGMDRFRVMALQKIIDSGELNDSQLVAATQVLREKCRILINGAEKRGNAALHDQITQPLHKYS